MPGKPKFVSENGLSYFWNAMKGLLFGKVDKEAGKGLSTNDYSTAEKNKLNGIAAGSQVNVIEAINVNGATMAVSNKVVNIAVPVNTNQLINGAGYQTASDVSSLIATALSQITSFEFLVVNELPASGVKGTIYLVPHAHGTNDGHDEYIWVNGAFEKLGHMDIDLSGYVETTDVINNEEIDDILAQ